MKAEKPKAPIARPLPGYNTSAEKEAFHILLCPVLLFEMYGI